MRKFRFQFETLEKVRKSREDEALRALSQSQEAFRAAQARKAEFERKLADSLLRRENLGSQPTPVETFILEQDFINGTKQRIIQSDQGILRAKRGVEKALRNYLAARRQTRTIEMLREKAFSEWKKEKARKEQKELDDLYVMRQAHSAAASGRDMNSSSDAQMESA